MIVSRFTVTVSTDKGSKVFVFYMRRIVRSYGRSLWRVDIKEGTGHEVSITTAYTLSGSQQMAPKRDTDATLALYFIGAAQLNISRNGMQPGHEVRASAARFAGLTFAQDRAARISLYSRDVRATLDLHDLAPSDPSSLTIDIKIEPNLQARWKKGRINQHDSLALIAPTILRPAAAYPADAVTVPLGSGSPKEPAGRRPPSEDAEAQRPPKRRVPPGVKPGNAAEDDTEIDDELRAASVDAGRPPVAKARTKARVLAPKVPPPPSEPLPAVFPGAFCLVVTRAPVGYWMSGVANTTPGLACIITVALRLGNEVRVVATGASDVGKSPINFSVPENMQSDEPVTYSVEVYLGTHATTRDLAGISPLTVLPLVCQGNRLTE